MYTSVDLSALHEKKRFTEKTESHIFRPQGWLLLLAGCYLIGIFLGCRVLRLAPDELLHGMKAVFSEHLAIRTAQTLRQLVISSFWQAMIPLLMLFLLGFCALALPVFPIMMGFEGMGYGVLISAALETAAETGSPGFRATLVFAPFLLCCALLWNNCSKAESTLLESPLWRKHFPTSGAGIVLPEVYQLRRCLTASGCDKRSLGTGDFLCAVVGLRLFRLIRLRCLYFGQRGTINRAFDLLAGDMCIDLSCGEILMPEDLLEDPDIGSAILIH